MPYKERDIEKVYFTIGEVANMLHVETSALRFWESEFSWFSPKKGKKGNRIFNRKDLQDAMDINFLANVMQFRLEGVRIIYQFGLIEEVKKIYTKHIRNKKQEPMKGKELFPLINEEWYEKDNSN